MTLEKIEAQICKILAAEYQQGYQDAIVQMKRAAQKECPIRRNNKKLSLYPLDMETALRAALQTGGPPRCEANK